MLPLFRDKCKIMYIDTVLYRVECKNVYETMKHDIVRFEWSSDRQHVRYAFREQKEVWRTKITER